MAQKAYAQQKKYKKNNIKKVSKHNQCERKMNANDFFMAKGQFNGSFKNNKIKNMISS